MVIQQKTNNLAVNRREMISRTLLTPFGLRS